jgi:hypothetical protein
VGEWGGGGNFLIFSEKMTSQKYIVVKNLTKEVRHINSWFWHCRLLQIPYLIICKRSKYAQIEFDYIHYDWKKDEIFRGELFKEQIIRIYKKYYIPDKSEFRCGMNFTLQRMPLSSAETVTEEIYDYIVEITK